jgi:hypothetical protein
VRWLGGLCVEVNTKRGEVAEDVAMWISFKSNLLCIVILYILAYMGFRGHSGNAIDCLPLGFM